MERAISVEEKIRRAEEIYEKRRQGETKPVAKVAVNDKKDIKLLRKMIIQILVCVAIYLTIYTIQNNQYIFSEDFINKVNEILSYDTNFVELYKNAENMIKSLFEKKEVIAPEDSIGGAEENTSAGTNNNTSEGTNENNGTEEGAQGSSEEENVDGQSKSESQEGEDISQDVNNETNVENLSQEEQDIINIKNTTSFIKPVEGTVSSKFGQRDTATGSVPKNHTGTDIAAPMGTKIKSATDGEVVLCSEEGDYRKALKNSNRRSKHNLCTLQ